MRFVRTHLAAMAAFVFVPGLSFAGGVTRADLTLDVSATPIAMRGELTIDTRGARAPLTFYLHRNIRITSASVLVKNATSAAAVESSELRGTHLVKWTVAVPKSPASGEGTTLRYEASIAGSASEGLWVDRASGFLPPGSGWLPQLDPGADELLAHTTTFVLPPGVRGVACGVETAPLRWSVSSASRPYAVWGEFAKSELKSATSGGPTFDLIRSSKRTGSPPRQELIEKLVGALEASLGPPCGDGSWKLIDVGRGVLLGGSRTLFWDESAAPAAGVASEHIYGRDLASALATAFWTECVKFEGDLAAWLSRGLAHYVGDVAYIALDPSPDWTGLEAIVIGGRRAAFVEALSGDRPLTGAVPASPWGPRLLATRGALVAHVAAEGLSSRANWMSFLYDFRTNSQGKVGDRKTFLGLADEMFHRHHPLAVSLKPFLETTDLPDFRIVSHGPADAKHPGRYRVEIQNAGKIGALAEVETFSAGGQKLYSYRADVGPNEKATVLFRDSEEMARVVVDPRGITPQSKLEGEVVDIGKKKGSSRQDAALSFAWEPSGQNAQTVRDFALDLGCASITGFEGDVDWYSSYHGPSGACLLGRGDVVIKPDGEFAKGFEKATGRATLSFRGSSEIWIRFPVERWEEIRAQLGGPTKLTQGDRIERGREIYEHSFPTYFHSEGRTQIPPPGSALIIFTGTDGERRGIVRQPLPDGRVRMRYWDHLHGKTIWEEVH
jgi:hypothetical protein